MAVNIAHLIDANTRRWAAFHFNTSKIPEFGAVANDLIDPNRKAQYQEISKGVWQTDKYWPLVGVVDSREHQTNLGLCNSYLGNGQPLMLRTTIAPKGRGPFLKHTTDPPLQGPFYRGGLDALIDVQNAPGWWKEHGDSIGSQLSFLESLNGLGYVEYHAMASPYIWGGTTEQMPGKYVSDGKFDPNVMDSQLGCAGLLRYIAGLDASASFYGAVVPKPAPKPTPTPEPPVIPMPTPTPTPTPPVIVPAPTMKLDLAAIEHTFEAIEMVAMPFLGAAIPASIPIVALLEIFLKSAAAVQAGSNLVSVLPTDLRAAADAIEKLAPKT